MVRYRVSEHFTYYQDRYLTRQSFDTLVSYSTGFEEIDVWRAEGNCQLFSRYPNKRPHYLSPLSGRFKASANYAVQHESPLLTLAVY